MTYYELVKAIQQACEDHKQLQSWGYGALSNVETPMINGDRRYPYAFLNPQPHRLEPGQIVYTFNLIVMDLSHGDFRDLPNDATGPSLGPIVLQGEDFVLRAQSDSLLIIQDILASIRYKIGTELDAILQTSVTPFEERFNDTVAGMTANIQIVLPNVLNYCDAPFN